jgi:hypothetical protein
MEFLAHDYATGLFRDRQPPCLSLYQATHRHHPSNRQDPIRFRNQVKVLEESLLREHPKREVESLLEPFHRLGDDEEFWIHTREGLAALGARGFFRVYRLQRPVTDLVLVSDSFHTKPLMRILQSADRYQILGLNRQRIRLFEGNRDRLDEIAPASDVPTTIEDALGREHTEPHLGVYSYGTGRRGPAMHHGHGGKKDDVDLDAERFFRAVDRAVYEKHSRPSGLPLLLAALPEYHKLFHEVSHNPHLMKTGLEVNSEALDLEGLRARAWEVVLPQYLERLGGLVEAFGAAKGTGKGTDDIASAAVAAAEGRIRTLLVDADQQVPGRMDVTTGAIELGGAGEAGVDDLLDDIGELVLRRGGEVVVVPHERMPADTGLAATFLY